MLEYGEGGCHCGRVRFRAEVDLDRLSQCSCTVCTKKGILHLPLMPEVFELLRGKHALTVYTFGTGVAQHAFCSHCGMHAFYIPRSRPHPSQARETVPGGLRRRLVRLMLGQGASRPAKSAAGRDGSAG